MASISAAALRELSENWKKFDIEMERARQAMEGENSQDEQTIQRLRAGIEQRKVDFKHEWANRRVQVRSDRDTAIKTLLKEGESQAAIMRMMGSNNSQLLSRLAKEALLEQAEEARMTSMRESEPEPQADAQIEGVVWHTHHHTGVHGWLLSEDGMLYKRYDTSAEEPSEAEWYVATVQGNAFIAGSREFFDRANMSAVEKRLGMLRELLEGSYAGKITIKPTPWAA